MKKTILYRLFGIGSVPKKLMLVLEQEGIVVLDEGIGGRLVTRHVDSPGKKSRFRKEGFSGSLAVTKARVICCTFGKRQINISTEDARISHLYVDISDEQQLIISFESSHFQAGWQGVIEYWFNTDKAGLFFDSLVAVGVRKGTAAEADKKVG